VLGGEDIVLGAVDVRIRPEDIVIGGEDNVLGGEDIVLGDDVVLTGEDIAVSNISEDIVDVASVEPQANVISFGGDCPGGQVLHADGNCVVPEVSQNTYLYKVPAQTVETLPPTNLPTPKVHLNYVFIRNDQAAAASKPVVIPPPKQKTLIYLLSRTPVPKQADVIEVPSAPVAPEVFFVTYDEGDDTAQLPGGITLREGLEQSIQQPSVIEAKEPISFEAEVNSVVEPEVLLEAEVNSVVEPEVELLEAEVNSVVDLLEGENSIEDIIEDSSISGEDIVLGGEDIVLGAVDVRIRPEDIVIEAEVNSVVEPEVKVVEVSVSSEVEENNSESADLPVVLDVDSAEEILVETPQVRYVRKTRKFLPTYIMRV